MARTIKQQWLEQGQYKYIHSTWPHYQEYSPNVEKTVVFSSSNRESAKLSGLNKVVYDVFRQIKTSSPTDTQKKQREIIKNAQASIQSLKTTLQVAGSAENQEDLFRDLQKKASGLAEFFNYFGYAVVDKNGKAELEKETDVRYVTSSMLNLLLRDYKDVAEYWEAISGAPNWFWGSLRNVGGLVGEISAMEQAKMIESVKKVFITGGEKRAEVKLTPNQTKILNYATGSAEKFLQGYAQQFGKTDIKMEVKGKSLEASLDLNFSVKNVIGKQIKIDKGVSLNTMFTMMAVNDKYSKYSFGSGVYYHLLNIGGHKASSYAKTINSLLGNDLLKVIMNTLMGNEIHFMLFHDTEGVPYVVSVEEFIEMVVSNMALSEKIMTIKGSKINTGFRNKSETNPMRARRVLQEVSDNIYFKLIVDSNTVLNNLK